MTMDNYKNIILVTDALKEASAAADSACNLAKQHGAKLTIVDTLRPPSTASRWFSSNADDVFDMVLADKQSRLDKITERFRKLGLDVENKVLVGKSSEEITREAVRVNADLVVRYMKGKRSRHAGKFGNTARNLMRICPCPLLLVGDQPVENPKVLACINAEHDDNENQAILREAERLAANNDKLTALYCWKFYGDEFLKEHFAESALQQTLVESEHVYRSVFEKFKQHHDLAAFGDRVRMEHGDPIEVIPEFCRHEEVDVAVMSSASQNHPILRLLGSTIESLLDQLPSSLMVVKPLGFKSPIKGADSTIEMGS
jgi:nucleotide-binding universal stress UspA family protein